MKAPTASAIALVLLGFAEAQAARVEVIDRSTGRRCSTAGAIVARRDDEILRIPLTSSQTAYLLDLKGEGSWRVAAETKDCWSTSEDWQEAAVEPLVITLFGAGEASGALVGDSKEALTSVPAFVSGLDQSQRLHAVECVVDLSRWRCRIPADVKLDLRLEPPGFAYLFYWDVLAKAGEPTLLEPRKLERGGSIAGWLQTADGKAVVDATVRLAALQDSAAARPLLVKTQRKGFFQFVGLRPGEYRLVADHTGLAPAVVPTITVREGESIVWPRQITLVAPLSFAVNLTPAVDSAGLPWMVSLTEVIPLVPNGERKAVSRAATREGRWTAQGLRPSSYRLVVRDGAGATVEQVDVDLSRGDLPDLVLDLNRIAVSGTLTVGDEPLAAEIRFSTRSGKTVSATSDAEGRFAAAFPVSGEWSVSITSKSGARDRRSRIRGPVVTVPERGAVPGTVDIRLSGSRLRGKVVTRLGQAVRAAVHVSSGERLVAQQITGEDGEFDFIGMEKGTYRVSAEAENGASTTHPIPATLDDDGTAELTLTVEPMSSVRIRVITPSGAPASGALVRTSLDGGLTWTDVPADMSGTVDQTIPAGSDRLSVAALTHSYPTALLTVPIRGTASETITVILKPVGGRLLVLDPRFYLIGSGSFAPMSVFYFPRAYGVEPVAHVETGTWSLCREPVLTSDCRSVVITPNSDVVVDTRKKEETP